MRWLDRSQFLWPGLIGLLLLAVACSDVDPVQPISRAPDWPTGDLLDLATPSPDHLLVLSAAGRIYLSKDAGETFHTAHVPASSSLRSFAFGTAEAGWAVGPGVILRTDDGGAHWRRLRGPRRAAELDLFEIAAIDDQRAIALGRGGLRLRTSDGGAIWQEISAPTGASEAAALEWTALACAPGGAGQCWAVADEIYFSPDAGATWTLVERADSIPVPPVEFEFGRAEISEADAARIRDAYEARPRAVDLVWQIDVQVSPGEVDRIAGDADASALFDLIEARGEELRLLLEGLGVPSSQVERLGTPPWGYQDFLDDDPELLDRYWDSRRAQRPGAALHAREPVALSSMVVDAAGEGWAVGRGGRGFVTERASESWTPFGIPGAHDLLAVERQGPRVIAAGGQGGLWVGAPGVLPWTSQVPRGSEVFFDVLRAIAFDPERERGYVAGDGGLLFVTVDGGRSWASLAKTGKGGPPGVSSSGSASIPINP